MLSRPTMMRCATGYRLRVPEGGSRPLRYGMVEKRFLLIGIKDRVRASAHPLERKGADHVEAPHP